MKTVVSVVIPIYNVENYLKRCLDSVLKQTYQELEILLIDDGSSDFSGQIADDYAEMDQRIKVVHQKNKGVAAARNTGIECASGTYICFVDSDDYVHEEYVNNLFKTCMEYDSDIAVCNFAYTDGRTIGSVCKGADCSNEGKCNTFDNLKMLHQLYGETYLRTVVLWNKLYHRKLFDTIRFPEGRIHEDDATTYKLLFKAKNITVIEKTLYYYFQNADSIMHKKYSLKRLDILKAIEERRRFFYEKKYMDLYYMDSHKYMTKIMDQYGCVKGMDSFEGQSEILKNLKKVYWKTFRDCRQAPWSFKRKIKLFVFGNFPSLYAPIIKKNRGL